MPTGQFSVFETEYKVSGSFSFVYICLKRYFLYFCGCVSALTAFSCYFRLHQAESGGRRCHGVRGGGGGSLSVLLVVLPETSFF